MPTIRDRITSIGFNIAYGMHQTVIPGIILAFLFCLAFMRFETPLEVIGLIAFLFCFAAIWELLALLVVGLVTLISQEV